MLEATGFIRKMDTLGRIIIPFEARGVLGFAEQETLEALIDKENGYLIFRKPIKRCLKCESTQGIKHVKANLYLCKDCIEELK